MNINWILLIIGGLFETCFAISLSRAQHSSGPTMWYWLLSFLVCVSLSMYLLYLAMGGKYPIPVGTAYAVWAGIGAVGSVLVGIFFLAEPITFWRLFFLTLLILSIVGIQLVS
jgi:quaternary ammonium compound-resistance protein SugE